MTMIRLEDALMDALSAWREARACSRAERKTDTLPGSDHSFEWREIQRVIADLGADWVFLSRLDAMGRLETDGFDDAVSTHVRHSARGFDPDLHKAIVFEEDHPRLMDHFERGLSIGSDRIEFRLVFPEATVRWVESSLRTTGRGDREDPLRLYGALRDITARRATEEALRKSESQYRALVEQASDGILVFEPSGRIVTSNSAAKEIFGLDQEALHRKKIIELFYPDDLDHDPDALANLAAGRTLRSVRRLKQSGGENWIWTELSARRLQDGRVQVTIRDITARMEAERRIRNLAYFDSLTGLPNRELFREQIEIALERCRRVGKQLALLFLDVDRFKQVNDSLGHSSGDILLTQVADRLRSAVRGSDSIGRSTVQNGHREDQSSAISRLGGDEFTILIQDLDHPQDAARVARRVLHALSRPYRVSDQEIFVGSSIGIAVWPEDGETSEHLLRSADTAMYHAKAHGGNAYEFFSSAMNVVSTRRLNVETHLRRALERDQFHLVYQPIRDTRTGRISAAEALLRWVDAEGESITPDEFIPIAEETGLIVEIGAWVLRTACRRVRTWQLEGRTSFRLSVNISVAQLRDLGVVDMIDQILFESELDPADLELEITESSILDANPNVVAAVGQLTDMGIGFALDDFGTGYSSLSALQRFPIERIKIDRSFVAGVGESAKDEALVSAIVALARRLDRRVVAEGVESETQARFLTGLGCDELQGYLFGRPLSVDAFGTHLEREGKADAS